MSGEDHSWTVKVHETLKDEQQKDDHRTFKLIFINFHTLSSLTLKSKLHSGTFKDKKDVQRQTRTNKNIQWQTRTNKDIYFSFKPHFMYMSREFVIPSSVNELDRINGKDGCLKIIGIMSTSRHLYKTINCTTYEHQTALHNDNRITFPKVHKNAIFQDFTFRKTWLKCTWRHFQKPK